MQGDGGNVACLPLTIYRRDGWLPYGGEEKLTTTITKTLGSVLQSSYPCNLAWGNKSGIDALQGFNLDVTLCDTWEGDGLSFMI